MVRSKPGARLVRHPAWIEAPYSGLASLCRPILNTPPAAPGQPLLAPGHDPYPLFLKIHDAAGNDAIMCPYDIVYLCKDGINQLHAAVLAYRTGSFGSLLPARTLYLYVTFDRDDAIFEPAYAECETKETPSLEELVRAITTEPKRSWLWRLFHPGG
jgi:hypothetical protein